MRYKAIISDVDGTLTPLKEYSQLSETIKNAIKSVQDKNISFSLATGKPFYLIEHLIDELQLTSPVIVDNGAAIYNPLTKKPLWESVMDRKELAEVFALATKYKKRIRISAGKNSVDAAELTTDHQNVTKLLIMGLSVKEAEEYIAQVEQNYKNLAIVRAQAYEGEGFFDIYITNAEATKQHAVLKLAEILGIKTEEMIGIGDHYNDFPLLMSCGLKVAMGNAVDDLKAIADYIAPSVEEDGVANVIEKFIL